ncbi:helix-turn-helix domain-containing protein [Actinoplanes oblitus]|uniref:Helix-turn-helix domain-containing protein n=1 Tax=Actinoplanes oblitus TaxID=3040509 RepID=A0ABY8W480_9ACTN|nr:helix-turn-helix domain-containing protein [Actinoplanes oblitus]WIM92674.1 helix-turn-helix domain-containing protein [Actinoplanes oblitus]
MREIFSSDDLPAAERLAGYREAVGQALVPVNVHADPGAPIRVRMGLMMLGQVEVCSVSATDDAHVEISRPRRLIRRSDPEAFRLLLALRGRIQMTQGDRSPRLTPGQMAFYDTSRPFHGSRRTINGRLHLVTLTVSRGLLPVADNLVKSMIAAPIAGRHGVAALMVDVVDRLLTDATRYTAADASRLAPVVLDLMTAVLSHELGDDAGRPASPESRRRVLHTSIQAFVQQRLGDPGLTPRSIAAAHHISVRLLHQLYQEQGETVAGSIRAARLERCRADLGDPLRAGCSITTIAARWGFTDYAHFSKLFRAAYGLCPRDWRHQHQP